MHRGIRVSVVSMVVVMSAVAFAKDEPAKLEVKEPITCEDTGALVVEGAYIKGNGKQPAIHVVDSCSITITNSFIESSGLAISVEGTGNVTMTGTTVYGGKIGMEMVGSSTATITDSTIAGKKRSLSVKATATATASGTQFLGKRKVTRFAKFNNGGKNKVRKAPRKRLKPPPH